MINNEYEQALQRVLTEGNHKSDRTGTGTTSVFGHQMRFNLAEGFPLITTKKVHTKSIIHELLWFLQGSGNTRYLDDNNVRIWNEWKDENDNLGPVYGAMWRYYPTNTYNETTLIRPRTLTEEETVFEDDGSITTEKYPREYELWKSNLTVARILKRRVGESWTTFTGFMKTISRVPFYYLWQNSPEDEYTLTGDYYGSDTLSYQTAMFVPESVLPDITSNSLNADGLLTRPKLYIDQIAEVIGQIKTNPDSRRLIVNAWNPAALQYQALPPCHSFFQFYVNDGKLSCQLYQRSVDSFLGLPFNIASYALLLHMIAAQTGLEVGEFVHTSGDLHIYDNHQEQVKLQLSRDPRPFPTLTLTPRDSIDDYVAEDFHIEGYDPHPHIAGKVSV